MKQFEIVLCCTLFALAAAQSGYRYPNLQQIPLRNGPVFRPQSNSGIVSVQQSQPLAQFNLNGGISSGPAPLQQSYLPPSQPQPQPLPAPAPAPAPQLPQNSYLPPQSGNGQSSFGQSSFGQPSFGQSSFGQSTLGQSSFGQSTLGQSSFGQPSSAQSQQQSNFQNYPQQQQTIITKDIYIHSAPEDQEESALNNQYENVPIRKNYRIVFIKTPSQNINFAAAALKRAQPNHEDKTVIYVLSKKPDFSEVQQQLAQVNNEQKSHKPEVYFIKYRTQEEAQRAQQEIQAQYDALGGSTHISDEGIAPIRSVIGSTGSNGFNLGSSSGGSGSNGFNIGSGSGGSGSNGFNLGSGSGGTGSNGFSLSSSSGGSSSNGFSLGGSSGGSGSNGFNLGGSSGGSGSFGAASQQQQSFVQQPNLQQSGSSSGFGAGPAQKYLPVKATK